MAVYGKVKSVYVQVYDRSAGKSRSLTIRGHNMALIWRVVELIARMMAPLSESQVREKVKGWTGDTV